MCSHLRVRVEVVRAHVLRVRRKGDGGAFGDVLALQTRAALAGDARKEERQAEAERLVDDAVKEGERAEGLQGELPKRVLERLLELGAQLLEVVRLCHEEVARQRHHNRGALGPCDPPASESQTSVRDASDSSRELTCEDRYNGIALDVPLFYSTFEL